MKIIVFAKQVPDTWGERKLVQATRRVDRTGSEAVIDEIGERALEAALSYQDDHDAEVVVATMGPASAEAVVRHGLALGADSGIHVLDESLEGADALTTAKVLAAVAKRAGFDLIVTGNESTDGRGGIVGAMVAEILGIPHATFLNSLEIETTEVRGERGTDYGTLEVVAPLPALVSVTEQAPSARFPGFRGIMRAKKKPLEVVSVAELGLDGLEARSVMLSAAERPARTSGKKIVDEGEAAQELVGFLASRHLI